MGTRIVHRGTLLKEAARQTKILLEQGFAKVPGFAEQADEIGLMISKGNNIVVEESGIPLLLVPTLRAASLDVLVTAAKINDVPGYTTLNTEDDVFRADKEQATSFLVALLDIQLNTFAGQPVAVALTNTVEIKRRSLEYTAGLAIARLFPESINQDRTLILLSPTTSTKMFTVFRDKKVKGRFHLDFMTLNSQPATQGDPSYTYPTCNDMLVPKLPSQIRAFA